MQKTAEWIVLFILLPKNYKTVLKQASITSSFILAVKNNYGTYRFRQAN